MKKKVLQFHVLDLRYSSEQGHTQRVIFRLTTLPMLSIVSLITANVHADLEHDLESDLQKTKIVSKFPKQ